MCLGVPWAGGRLIEGPVLLGLYRHFPLRAICAAGKAIAPQAASSMDIVAACRGFGHLPCEFLHVRMGDRVAGGLDQLLRRVWCCGLLDASRSQRRVGRRAVLVVGSS